jgi:DNA-binding transcriptional LysR family regulator
MADLNALAAFAKVMEAGSFSEGAHRLKMPISTVSRRVAELEGELGVRRSGSDSAYEVASPSIPFHLV